MERSLTLVLVIMKTQKAEVWLAKPDGSDAMKWIENIDPAPNFYEMRDWHAVINYYN
jgi:hypothetical protein